MKYLLVNLLGFFLLFAIHTNGISQSIQVRSLSEQIQVNSDTTYTINVAIILKENTEPLAYPVFYDHELEQVSDIKVYTKYD